LLVVGPFVVTGALAVVLALWWWIQPEISAPTVTQDRASLSPPLTNEVAKEIPPQVVRIVTRGHASAGSEESREKVLASVVHRGELRGSDYESMRGKLMDIRDRAERELRMRTADPADSAALLQEAEVMMRAAKCHDALDALANGSYVVSYKGDETPPLTMPESEVIRIIGHSKDGILATVTIIIPWARHDRTAQSRHYYDGVLAWDNSERARKFNSLPDAERLDLARRISRIRNNPNATEFEKQWVRDTIGFATELNPQSAIVILPERR
jgi:hypothetical protein